MKDQDKITEEAKRYIEDQIKKSMNEPLPATSEVTDKDINPFKDEDSK